MTEIEHLVMPALRAAGRPTTYENQERMRKALTEAAATQKRNQRTMSKISEKEVEAAAEALHYSQSDDGKKWPNDLADYERENLRIDARAALEAAAHARAEAVGVKVKPLDAARLAEAESEITEYQRERSRWIDYTTDLQRIIEALCNRRALPEPVSTARHHYEMARSALAHPAVPEGMVMVRWEDLSRFFQRAAWTGEMLNTLSADEYRKSQEAVLNIQMALTQSRPKPPVAAAEKEGE